MGRKTRRVVKEKKTIYYEDERNDEFSEAQINPIRIDGDYEYFHGGIWDAVSCLVQNVFSMPVKVLYQKYKFHLKYIGREKLWESRNTGYFIYGNHTQPFADTFIPSVANYPKRNFFIVNPENVSMPGMRRLVELLGAIPVPDDFNAMKKFLKAVRDKIESGHSVTIYPEAHIWPYHTGIRPFGDVSFQYPVKLNCPVYALTNTYHERKGRPERVDIITYIDGPFYPDESLKPKERQKDLRDKVYECMVRRSLENTYEAVVYIKKEK